MFILGNNQPGCLPDTPPDTAEDFESAKQMLIESLEHFYDDTEFYHEEPQFRHYLEQRIQDIADWTGKNSIQIDGRCWFIEQVR